MRISLGYPSIADEVVIMERQQYSRPIEQISPVAEAADLIELQETVKRIYVDDLVKHYIASLVDSTRHHDDIYLGSSPRGSLALFRTAQARALLEGRDFVLPDDIKALAGHVLAHRLVLHPTNGSKEKGARIIVEELLDTIPVPGAIPRP